jgi:hypothetical protein
MKETRSTETRLTHALEVIAFLELELFGQQPKAIPVENETAAME